MMLKNCFVFFSFVFATVLTSCDDKDQSSFSGNLYSIEIHYSDSLERNYREGWDAQINEDSLYIFFENGFKNDSITVLANGRIVTQSVISTDKQNGSAGHFVYGNIEGIPNVSLRINGGPLIYFEQPRIKRQIFNCNYNINRNRVIFSVLDHAPFYD